MKITRKPVDDVAIESMKEQANKNCYVCPFCGEAEKENTRSIENIKKGEVFLREQGIRKDIPTSITKGIFRPHVYRVDNYTCLTCGAQWKSEPYRTDYVKDWIDDVSKANKNIWWRKRLRCKSC